MTKANVYIVDDDAAIRDSLQIMLEADGYAVRGFASPGSFLLEASSLKFGCLLADLQMPGIDGLELLRHLAENGAALPVVMITGHGDVSTAVRAMRAGAVDFVEKPFTLAEIKAGIDLALAVERPMQSTADRMRIAILERIKILSPRERQVMDGMVAGHPNKVIAYQLALSPRTVEIHRARVMDKMQARSLSELVRLALSAGLNPDFP